MISAISFTYSPLWLLPVIAGALGAVWVLYFSRNTLSRSRRNLLASLRFFTLLVLGLLLLAPMLEYRQITDDKPLLIWLEDHSTSMVSGKDSAAVVQGLNKLSERAAQDLEEKYRLVRYSFDDDLHTYQLDSFGGELTDVHSALNEVSERHYNENTGAMVLISDGIYNRGANPVYAVQSMDFPVFTVGTGDTTILRDLFIEDLNHNRITYLDNEFPLEVAVRARMLNGGNYSLTVKNTEGKTVFSDQAVIDENDYFHNFRMHIPATLAGLQKFNIQLSPLEGEVNTANNDRSFNIEVIDNRKKIVILGGGAHPDLAAIGRSLSSLEKYEVEIRIASEAEITDTDPDLLVLHQPNAQMLSLAKSTAIPYWIIGGASGGVAYEELGGMRAGSNQKEMGFLIPANNFSLFSLEEEFIAFSQEMPPLQIPFGRIELGESIQPMFYKKIGSVETREPLWFFTEENALRSAHTLATGLWRWRMYDYRRNGSFELFDGLIAQTVQYLTARSGDRRFVVEHRNEYSVNEPVKLTARLYNKSLELVNEPVVNMLIRSEDGTEYQFDFSKQASIYQLDAGNLPPANYTFTATTSLGNEEFTRNGAFSILKREVEQSDLLARHDLLHEIAEATGGEFHTLQTSDQLIDQLLQNNKATTIQFENINLGSLLRQKWIFFLLLALLAAEWGLRKYFGKY